VLPALEQRVDHDHHGMGLDERKYEKLKVIIKQWLVEVPENNMKRKIFPTLEQINGEGTKRYYDVLMQDLKSLNLPCETIPTVMVESDEAFEVIKEKLLMLTESPTNVHGEVFVKRTFSCESRHVEWFPVTVDEEVEEPNLVNDGMKEPVVVGGERNGKKNKNEGRKDPDGVGNNEEPMIDENIEPLIGGKKEPVNEGYKDEMNVRDPLNVGNKDPLTGENKDPLNGENKGTFTGGNINPPKGGGKKDPDENQTYPWEKKKDPKTIGKKDPESEWNTEPETDGERQPISRERKGDTDNNQTYPWEKKKRSKN